MLFAGREVRIGKKCAGGLAQTSGKMFCVSFVLMKMKSYFNFTIAFSEISLKDFQ